jgi:hypothetical protein
MAEVAWTTGAGFWEVPTDVWSIIVECTGEGGAASPIVNLNYVGRAGGGGGYAKSTFPVRPGDLIYYNTSYLNKYSSFITWASLYVDREPESAEEGVLAYSGSSQYNTVFNSSNTTAYGGGGGAGVYGQYTSNGGQGSNTVVSSGTVTVGDGGFPGTSSGNGSPGTVFSAVPKATNIDSGSITETTVGKGGKASSYGTDTGAPFFMGQRGGPPQVKITYETRAPILVASKSIVLLPGPGYSKHDVTDVSKAAQVDCVYKNLTAAVGDQLIVKTKSHKYAQNISVASDGITTVADNQDFAVDYYYFDNSQKEWTTESRFTRLFTATVNNIDLDDTVTSEQTGVEINGTGFGTRAGLVLIGGRPQNDISTWTDTKIVLNTLDVDVLTGQQPVAIYKPKP